MQRDNFYLDSEMILQDFDLTMAIVKINLLLNPLQYHHQADLGLPVKLHKKE